MKRKMHYNEAQNIKLARQLIEKELRGDAANEEDEDEDEEMSDAAGSEQMSPGRGELFVLKAHASSPAQSESASCFCSLNPQPGRQAGRQQGVGSPFQAAQG